MNPTCCSDFTRTQLLRRATAATAGAGLPAIEPGMPLPAGTGLTRRSMLLRGVGLGLSVYGAGRIFDPKAFEAGIAQAATGQPVIVSVFMPGGADSLSLLAPVGDPRYAALRPTLALAEGSGPAFRDDPRLMWHPSAHSLADLHAAGKVTAIPAIGYDHSDSSHFTSRHFWEVGATDAALRQGWLGRYLDTLGDVNNPIQGLSLDTFLSPALATSNVAVAATSAPSSYKFWSPGVGSATLPTMASSMGAMGALPTSDPVLAQARQAQANSTALSSSLNVTLPASGVSYPSGSYAQQLSSLAQLLGAGLPIRCATVTAPGAFDTHSSQAGALSSALAQTVDGIAAFQHDIEARGIADRVLVLLWSEFGRRPHENGSLGTDHGAGGAAFVIGTRASGTLVGEFPGLDTLDDNDNLRSNVDYRSVYCSLLEQWMGVDAGPIIPGAGGFARPRVVA